MFSFPASSRHAASEAESSIACVPPFPELGKKVWALSPTCITLPAGECHVFWGSLHSSFQSITLPDGVDMTNLRVISGHPASVMYLATFSTGVKLCQDSCAEPSSYKGCNQQGERSSSS